MRLMLDTHFLIWSVREKERISERLAARLTDPENTLVFSVVSLWEIAIKHGRGRPDFHFDPVVVRPGLLAQGYEEQPITGPQVIATASLPDIHRDPFDRLLVTQAHFEGITLLTSDPLVAQYPGPIELVE
ncbi:UNVERIFIED_CONTAM: hypothetical protein GTU68_054467 [Idotea baltica]|nr:hypothetical protein [Idotea baltica]